MTFRYFLAGLAAAALVLVVHSAQSGNRSGCEWCGAHEAPQELQSETTIADPGEPGRRLLLTGTVYEPDGETPADGVLLYVHHTNAKGLYPTRGDETGNGRRHGYLRGWVLSDSQGRYKVHTIKPGSYPDRADPAHIHISVKEPGREEYWIDSVWFAGDPKITPRIRERRTGRGGEATVTLQEDPDGTLVARKDVVLLPAGDD